MTKYGDNSMTLAEALAARIDELLEQKNMTQYRLSMESGATNSMISEIRHCKNNSTALSVVYNIAQGFGMDLPDFFDSPLFRDGNIID